MTENANYRTPTKKNRLSNCDQLLNDSRYYPSSILIGKRTRPFSFRTMPQQLAGAPADLDTISAAMKRYNLNHSEVVSLQDVCTDCERLRLEGKELIAARRYIEATRVFREAICIIMGKDFGVPGWSKNHGMVMERYIKITDWQRVALMKCCNGIVQCRAMLDDMQGVSIRFLCAIYKSSSHPRFWTGLKKLKYFTNMLTSLQTLRLVSNATLGSSWAK